MNDWVIKNPFFKYKVTYTENVNEYLTGKNVQETLQVLNFFQSDDEMRFTHFLKKPGMKKVH